MQLQSLQLLSQAYREEPHRRYCCPASDAWFHALHGSDAPPSASQLREASGAFTAMMSTTASAQAPPAAEALRAVLAVAHVAPNPNLAEFPGPMCSPLCKKDVATLRRAAYTVTEKSDGLRVVVAALWVADFPAWEAAGLQDQLDHLSAVFALEEGRQQLLAESSPTATCAVTLHGRACTLQRATTADGEAYTLTGAEDGVTLPLRRGTRGRHLAYAIDRSMDAAHLFLDCHTSAQHRTFVLDGELMRVLDGEGGGGGVPRLLLGAFDLFRCAPAADGAAEASLVTASMMERYTRLRALLDCCTPPAATAEGRVCWYAKTMWRVAEMGECLSRLRYSPSHRCFLFDGPFGPTENDGLIFTPDAFPIAAGSSSVQLKWKWRHLLSIDWLLHPSDKAADVYAVSLFFMKKNYGHRDDVAGHWRLRRPMTIKNPRGFDIAVDTPVVAECAYDFRGQQWYIQRLRPDKRGANSVITAISVYESLVENIALPTLLAMLEVDAEGAVRQAEALEAAVAADLSAAGDGPATAEAHADSAPAFDVAVAEKCVTAKVTLRAIRESRGNTELYLNAYTNTSNKAVKFPLPFPLRKIRDCVGLGYDPSTATASVPTLEEALYIQLGNAGGCYAWSDFVVDAAYDGATGYWELVHLNPRGNNKEAIFDNVIEHLDWLLRCSGRAEGAALLQRRRDRPLVVAAAATHAATQQTSRHYGAVARELANAERSDLRRFNNWVKSVLMSNAAAAVRKGLKDAAKMHAVDLCCGRGGDLLKWQHLHPAFLFMSDASVECVAEAAARYSTAEGQSTKSSNGKKRGFPAFFAVHDAFDRASGLRGDLVKRGPFQLLSCQFSMHYGCRSEDGIRCFVRAVADALATRGRFVGTTVRDTELLARAKVHGASYGNTVYRVNFSPEAYARVQAADFDPVRLPCGVAYSTTVERSVQDMEEYVVPWEAFVRLCAEHHLRLLQDDDFSSFYAAQRETEEGRRLLAEWQRKRSSDGETTALPLSEEEIEAVQLYRLFVFEKTDLKAPTV